MQKLRQEDYLDRLMSSVGEELLDAETQSMARDMGEEEYAAFIKEYFSKQPKGHADIFLNRRAEQSESESEADSGEEMMVDTETPSLEEPHYEVSKERIEAGRYRVAYNNGDVYEGDMEHNQKNGWGVYSYASGEKYDGFFVEDEIHGFGKYRFLSGAEYDGEWFEGTKNGPGTLTYVNGDKYVGSFKDDHMDGKGKYVSANGDTFEGTWRQGKRHGRGEFNGVDGRFIIGEWADDKFTV